MPIVPRAQRSVETAPLPGVRVSTGTPDGAFGVAAPVDLSGPLKLVAGIDQERRQQAEQIKLQDADTALDLLQTDLETKAQQRRGVDALGAKDEAQAGWEKGVAEVEQKTLARASDQLRQAFRAKANQRWTRLYGGIESYTAAQMRQHDKDSTESALTNRVNGAVKDPTMAPQLAGEARALAADYGKRQGWSPEQLQAEQAKWVSRVHVGALSKMLTAGDDRTAQAYYDAHKAEVTGEDALRVEKALEEGSTLGAAQRNADAILQAKGVTRTDAYAKAKEITDPKERQATEKQLDIEFTRRDRAEADQYEAVQGRAYSFIEKGTRPPAPLWALLKPSDKRAFDAMLQHAAAGTEPKTDPATYYALKRAAADPAQRDEFQRTNLLKYRDKLSLSDFEELVNAQTKVKNGQESPLKGYLTQHDMISNAIQSLNLKNGSPERNAIEQAVDEEVKNVKRQTNKLELPDSEVQDIVDRLVVKKVYVDKAYASDDEKVAAALTTDERGNAYVKLADIPPADANRIRALMRANGKVPTDREVERAAAAMQLGDRQRFDVLIGARAKGTVTF